MVVNTCLTIQYTHIYKKNYKILFNNKTGYPYLDEHEKGEISEDATEEKDLRNELCDDVDRFSENEIICNLEHAPT